MVRLLRLRLLLQISNHVPEHELRRSEVLLRKAPDLRSHAACVALELHEDVLPHLVLRGSALRGVWLLDPYTNLSRVISMRALLAGTTLLSLRP